MGGYQCRFLAISCGPCSFIPSSFQGALHSLKRMHLSISRIVSVKRGWVTSLRVRAHSPHPAPARSEQRSARSTLPWLLVAATERCGGTLSGYTVLGAGQLLRHLPPPPMISKWSWCRVVTACLRWERAWAALRGSLCPRGVVGGSISRRTVLAAGSRGSSGLSRGTGSHNHTRSSNQKNILLQGRWSKRVKNPRTATIGTGWKPRAEWRGSKKPRGWLGNNKIRGKLNQWPLSAVKSGRLENVSC